MGAEQDNARLLAHPLPSLRSAVYAPKDAELPVAIFEDFSAAVSWSIDTYGSEAEVRPIALFSDRMPVAEPKWRSDS